MPVMPGKYDLPVAAQVANIEAHIEAHKRDRHGHLLLISQLETAVPYDEEDEEKTEARIEASRTAVKTIEDGIDVLQGQVDALKPGPNRKARRSAAKPR